MVKKKSSEKQIQKPGPLTSIKEIPISKEVKKKTKTYLSCWTCRSRNIKCDLGTPRCSICINSGLTCEGYGIKLVWEHNYKSKSDQSKRTVAKNTRNSDRRLILPDLNKFEFMNLSNDQLDKLLERFNALNNKDVIELSDEFELIEKVNKTCHNFKPFGVFQMKDNSVSIFSGQGKQENQSIQQSYRADRNGNSSSPATYQINDGALRNSEPFLKPKKIEFIDNSNDVIQISQQKIQKEMDAELANFLNNNLLNFFTKQVLDYDLIDYFLQKLSNIYIPIKFPYNPYQRIVFTLLFENIYNIDNFYNKGLYHSIITSSAFAIYNHKKDEHFLGLGEHHKKKALGYISKSFEDIFFKDELNNMNLEILIASIFNMVCCELVRGEKDWIIHCKGFLKLINFYADKNFKISPELSFMFQMFKVFIGINFVNDNFEINLTEFNQLTTMNTLIMNDYFLDQLYGITNHSLDLFMRIIIIKKYIDEEMNGVSENLTVGEWWHYRDSLVQSFKLENELYGGKHCLIYNGSTGASNINNLILHYQSKNFYNAILIFYKREILKEPLKNIQHLIIESLNLMEEIEKLSFFNNFKYGSIGIIWPNFIISCECIAAQYQERFEIWFKNVERYNFAVLNKSFKVVQAVWSKRLEKSKNNEDINDISLHDVMKEMNVTFILS